MHEEKVRGIAAEALNVGKNRVWIDPEEKEKVLEAMTRQDVRELIEQRVIKKKKENFQSRARARILEKKKKRGRKKGAGKRKGRKRVRMEKKKSWIKNVRALRKKLKELKKEKPKEVEKIGYRKLYRMIKGNYFRGKKYLEAFVKEKHTKGEK